MKRILALFLLAVLLPTVLPAIAEEEDYTDILTAELWVSGNGNTLLLNKDGTGKLKRSGETVDGTWTWLADEGRVSFTYQFTNDNRKVFTGHYTAFIQKDRDGSYYLDSFGSYYYQNSYLGPIRKSAEEKRYYLHWNENAPVNFVEFKLSNAYIYHSVYEPLTKYDGILNANKNTQYLFAVGTVKWLNASDQLWLGNIDAEFILDGKRKYRASVTSTINNKTYDDFIENDKEQKIFIYSPIPVSFLNKAETAELRLSFYNELCLNKLSGTPRFECFGLRLSAPKLAAMKKTPAKKKTYYKESAKMPVPASYIDVKQDGARETVNAKLKLDNKKVYCYSYLKKYSCDNIKSLYSSYVKALKADGYKVEKLNTKSTGKYSLELINPYKIIYGKTWVGTISLGEFNRIIVYLFR